MNREESPIRFETKDGLSIEGMIAGDFTEKGAILCHPHPQYGGSMNNNVVFAARDTFLEHGIGTLRFNFRGVGMSEGSFDDGRGEAIDILGARDYLRDEWGTNEITVAAYSFGSRVFLGAVKRGLRVEKAILISPPVSFMDFSELHLPEVPTQIVVGEHDEFCHEKDLEKWLQNQESKGNKVELTVLPGVDHFYGGRERLLSEAIGNHI